MKKLFFLYAFIAPIFAFGQLSVSVLNQISTSYNELKYYNNEMLALSSDGLTIDLYNISSPTQPILLNSKTLASAVSHIELMGDYALATTANSVMAYSLATANMPLISTFPVNGNILSFSVNQNYAYISLKASATDHALWYVNYTTPANPVLKNYITFYNPIGQMVMDGTRGYLVEHQPTQSFVYVFDITSANLQIKGMKNLDICKYFDVKNGKAYLADNQKIKCFTIAANGNFNLTNTITTANISGISATANGQCVAMKDQELTVYELQGAAVYEQNFALTTTPNSIINSDKYLLCATATSLYILEIANTTSANVAPTLSALNVYPNPAKDSWKIDASNLEMGDYSLVLHNMFGEVVYSETLTGGDVWAVENRFDAGTYFYTVEKEGNRLATGKLIGL
jgi:hypothetical protein